MTTAAPSHADASFVEFLRRRITVTVATRDAQHVPTLVRALGYHYQPRSMRLSVYVAAAQSGELADHIRDNGCVAVVFSEPSSHVSMQVKSSAATIERATAQDRVHAQAYLETIVAEIAALNYPEPMLRAMFDPGPDTLLAVRFTPTQFFAQTPGPGAGRRFEGATR